MGIGALRETLVIQANTPLTVAVSTLTRTSVTATVTTTSNHGYLTGDYIQIAGATPDGYNGRWKATVTGATTFTYAVPNTLTTPATGTITAVYGSDAQGGRRIGWTTLRTAPAGIPAQLLPLRAWERLQAQALQAQLDYRFRIRSRVDLTPQMRALWQPSWPPGAPTHTLEIHGILPDGDGRTFQLLEVGELT